MSAYLTTKITGPMKDEFCCLCSAELNWQRKHGRVLAEDQFVHEPGMPK